MMTRGTGAGNSSKVKRNARGKLIERKEVQARGCAEAVRNWFDNFACESGHVDEASRSHFRRSLASFNLKFMSN